MKKLIAGIGICLVISLIGVPAFPQETFFSETIEIRVINVDVIVTKDGKPVSGLTKDDFVIYENRRKQEITNFTEFRGTSGEPALAAGAAPQSAPAPTPDTRTRRVVLFLDASSLQLFNRQRIIEPMRYFLRTGLRPNDQVMIVEWKRGLAIRLPFTNDISAALKTLDALADSESLGSQAAMERQRVEEQLTRMPAELKQALGSGSRQIEMKPDIQLGLDVARAYAQNLQAEMHARVGALESVVAGMRGLEGRKALVYVTENLTADPARPIFELLNQIKDGFEGSSTFNPTAEAARYADRLIVKELADTANSSDVTLYPISASGLNAELPSSGADPNRGEYTMAARSVERPDATFQTLQQIAGLTGGRALTGSNDFQLAFETVATDLSTYYSLGYRSQGERIDSVRTIDVKLRRPQPGLLVRARQSFVEKSLTSEMSDAVAANLFYPVSHNDLAVSMSAGTPAPAADRRKVVVPVQIKVPTAGLTLIPDGQDLVGRFSSFTAFVRRDGRVSEVARLQHQLRFPAASLKRRREILVKVDITMDPRTEGISVGVMDDVSHVTGFVKIGLGPEDQSARRQ